jgi:high-affinity nickel-transport protein
MAAGLIGLHVAGWGLLLVVVVPGHFGTSEAPIGVGIGLTGYTLGMRHAFDADHIAAIDNVTRRLAVDTRRRSLTVGFFFSLGHSSVVFALTLVLAFGLSGVVTPMLAEGSELHHLTSILGASISGTFLLVVGAMNVVSLSKMLKGRARADSPSAPTAPAAGPLGRVFRRPLRLVGRAGHMYPIGFLFGLGFDTATEIGLLVIAASSVAAGLPWYGLLSLPLLFAAGMVLFDSLDGVFVSYAYGWALAGDKRKVRYNVIVTVISVVVAGSIGLIELTGAASEGFAWNGPLRAWLDGIDLNVAGVIFVATLTLVFLAIRISQRARLKQRQVQSIDTRPDPTT